MRGMHSDVERLSCHHVCSDSGICLHSSASVGIIDLLQNASVIEIVLMRAPGGRTA